MGGRAFLQHLPPGSLPRLPTPLYAALKARYKALLLTLFAVVEVPPENPEKTDHGDIDFVVTCPLNCKGTATSEQVGHVLGAVKSIELEGNRTSNYAVCISQEDWLMHTAQPLPSAHIHCQVDVRVCNDEQEVERIIVFHGYGDLGIIITFIAKTYGLSVNHHGLKVTIALAHDAQGFSIDGQVASPQSNPPILLTDSPRLIFDFMGLSLERWIKGFQTVEEMFQFAATSRFFDPRRFPMRSFNKSVEGRNVYFDFLVWAQDRTPSVLALEPQQDAAEEALVAFGKKTEWDAMARESSERIWLKNNFSGKLVAEWTGLRWKGVKAVMDDVRSSVGGERALVGMELEHVKGLVLKSQNSLKLDDT